MDDHPFTVRSYPRAILHIDADAFFTSVEQALDPSLRGKPVVTGQERGIIACASYEAKARGVKRGVSLHDARRLCPGLIVLPSDYESYSLYSKRMFSVMRQFTPCVEEYSVDEAFLDITGMRRLYHCSYEEIARKIQQEIHKELGFTVSVGLSLSKALGKLCSKFRKPRGFTAVPGRYIHILLQRTALEQVWGFGPSTVNLLTKYGLRTAYDFTMRPQLWAANLLKKPGREIWSELRGESVWPVETEEKTTYGSIMKSKTFTPPSTDKEFIFAKLVKNVESAFMKARRYHLRPRMLGVILRRQDFRHDGLEAKLSRATSSTLEVMPLIRTMFEQVFYPQREYRSTMIFMGGLEDDHSDQFDLFEDRLKIDAFARVTGAIDDINHRYGKHAVRSATSLFLPHKPDSPRDSEHARKQLLFPGETARRRLNIPRMGIEV
ncbi:MAG: DNA polymerase IV [Lentisphaerae bacterium]|nr:DNA polymerase IV [Lentisphaerota bacterium]